MPKRKTNPCAPATNPCLSISSFDAALDLLACETFTRLDHLTCKFEAASGVRLGEGVVKTRWDEAVKRYWVMKGMDDLCCTAGASGSGGAGGVVIVGVGAKRGLTAEDVLDGEVKMSEGPGGANGHSDRKEGKDSTGRPLPEVHPGPGVVYGLTPEEEHEWRKWSPKVGDVVLVETAEDGIWPGKIIDKKTFFQGRSVPRGYHFFPVRIYNEDMPPTITIKSRLIPLHLRPNPPLLASTCLLSAYNHAANPTTFDMMAAARESLAAHNRTHPGVGDDDDRARIKADKEAWNKVVNWVMNERRGEKIRTVNEAREKRLMELAESQSANRGDCPEAGDGKEGTGDCEEDGWLGKKRRTVCPDTLPPNLSGGGTSSGGETDRSLPQTPWTRSESPVQSIFGPAATVPCNTPRRTGSPSLASYIRPSLSTPQRPLSPRRLAAEKRRSGIFTGVGEYSPRAGRGGTYTPPRILPSGDETAPSTGSPAPSGSFDFVSPLGPVRLGKLADAPSGPGLTRKGSLDVVKEEEEDVDGWTVVGKKGRERRVGSAPCADKSDMDVAVNGSVEVGEESMEL